jgi:hypothetical protein
MSELDSWQISPLENELDQLPSYGLTSYDHDLFMAVCAILHVTPGFAIVLLTHVLAAQLCGSETENLSGVFDEIIRRRPDAKMTSPEAVAALLSVFQTGAG